MSSNGYNLSLLFLNTSAIFCFSLFQIAIQNNYLNIEIIHGDKQFSIFKLCLHLILFFRP